MNKTLQLRTEDNVIIALTAITSGETVTSPLVSALDNIPAGHKLAAVPIANGEAIIKYGQIIGYASKAIQAGEHVHTHNVVMADIQREHAIASAASATVLADQPATFQGYRRANGSAATRNYIGVLTTVNCSATVARMVADAFRADALELYPNIDGVIAITHQVGCCMGAEEEGMQQLQRTLAGFARHPNFGQVFIIGLGCETNQISQLIKHQGLEQTNTLHSLTIQDKGGTRATVEHCVAAIKEQLPEINRVARQTIAARELTLGLECGGSDGYSGISANPALGAAVDLLVQQGGAAILSETPEIYGAEHLLTARADSPAVGKKLLALIDWWEDYARRNGSEMNNNPTHGNKAGGLTTILEKSLGAVAKGGSTRLMDVYRYAEPVTSRGLVFMDSPGYDPMSITGQVASGATVICFTTGRGSVYGCKPSPCIKLATNTAMYQKMQDDMDINCGQIIDGALSVQQMGHRIFEEILAVASGKKTLSEELGFGDNEFAPWMVGAQM